MPSTQIGVVYNVETNEVVRVIVPDNDADLDAYHGPQVGEAMLKMPRTQVGNYTPADVAQVVAQFAATGLAPP